MAIPGTPEYHREFMAKKAVDDAAVANTNALRTAVMEYENENPVQSTPVWVDPGETGGKMAYDSQAELNRMFDQADVEDDAAVERGLGRTDPLAVAGVAGVRGGQAGSMADQYAAALAAGYNAPSSPNPMRPVVERYAGTMGQLQDQEFGQTQDLQAAQMNEQQAHANAYAAEAGRQQGFVDTMQRKAERDAARAQAAVQASQLVQAKVTEAADRLNEAPDIDPNRYWASQSAGRKFAWGLQAALMGFAGLDPFGALQSAITQDIDAQKANFAQKQAGFGARQGELEGQRSVYADMRTAIGDEQATDLMMESARLQQADAAFKAMAIKEGIPVAEAANNVFLTQMQQRQAEITKALETMLVTTPERIGGGFKPTLQGFQRKIAEQEYARHSKRADKFDELAVTQGGEAARQETAIAGQERIEGVKAEGRGRAAMAKVEAKQAESLQKAIQDPEDVISIIDNMLAISEKSGGGVPDKFGPVELPDLLSSEEGREWKANAGGLRLVVQKWASGAHLSESQFEQVEKMLPSDSDWTGGRAVGKIRALKKFMQNISKRRQRGFGESARKTFYRAEDLPEVQADYVPEDGDDPVEVDEG